MSSTTEQIKERLGIVEVVSQYIKLEKAGNNMKAKCPFHNEKTPSFMVSPSRNSFYCFGCNIGGDVFTFVEEFEGVDFMGALKVLGERAGVQVVFENKEVRDERSKLYTTMDEAARFFEANLTKEKKVLAYLKDRGLHNDTIQSWQLGYAKNEWRTLHEYFTGRGYSETDILTVGLIKKTDDGRHYDLFRDRIMFPLRDSSGRVIAFSGRIFTDDDKAPKYVNSPETPLFNKSKVLYGYDRAKLAIRKFTFSIVVEGQMDLLMSHQAGYTNTVAVSGTALTSAQLSLLNRLSSNIVMAFDSDSAGIQSSGKSAELGLSMGMDVKIAALPEGSDPADLVKKGKDEWKTVIKHSKHIVDFYLDLLSESIADKRKLRLEVQRVILPYIAKIPNNIDQAHFVTKVAERLGIGEEPVWEEVRKASSESEREHTALVKKQASSPIFTRKETIEQKLLQILAWQRNMGKSKVVDTGAVQKRLESIVGKKHTEALLKSAKEANDKASFELERIYTESDKLKQEVEELLLNFEKEYLEEECATALEALKQAEAEQDHEKTEKTEQKYKKLAEKLTTLKAKLLAEEV